MISISVEELPLSYKIRFPYQKEAVERIKTIPGRQFRKDLGNCWLIPKTSQRALERFIDWAQDKEALKEIQRPYVDPASVYPTRSKGEKPWKHQMAAFQYLWNRQASLLELKPGSGKSKIFVDYCLNHPDVRRVLILCPKSFVQGWQAQFEKHGGAPVMCACLDDMAGTVVQRVQVGLRVMADAQRRNMRAVVVVNYDVCWREAEVVQVHKQQDSSQTGFFYEVHVPDEPYFVELFGAEKYATWDTRAKTWIVRAEGQKSIQEARAYWKQQTSKDGSAYGMADFLLDAQFDVVGYDEVQRLRGAQTNVSKFAHRLGASISVRIGLSGTPFPETPLDSFGVCRALDASLFGTSFVRFRSQYAQMGGYGNYKVLNHINQHELRAKIDTLRFTMEPEGYELPPEQDVTIPLVLPEKVQRLYRTLETELYAKVATGEIYLANAAVAFGKLQQVCSGYIVVEDSDTAEKKLTALHTRKADALADLFDSIPLTQSIVVICRFHYDLAQIHKIAKVAGRESAEVSGRSGRPHAHIDGGVWIGPETVLAVQANSGVEGLDLTRAHIMCYYSYGLELGKYTQSRARIRRAGQKEPCTYYHLVIQGGIDKKIRVLLDKKQHVLQGLLKEGGVTN